MGRLRRCQCLLLLLVLLCCLTLWSGRRVWLPQTPDPPNQKGVVCTKACRNATCAHSRFMGVRSRGRLANQIWAYASLVGIASRLGFVPAIPHNEQTLSKIFHITACRLKGDLVQPRLYQEKKCCTYEPKALELDVDFNWALRGYFQSWRYFHHVSSRIRSEFRFKDAILEEVKAVFRDLGHYHRVKVAVHVRRGDFTRASHKKRGYSMASAPYFRRAMDYFRSNLTNPLFVVLSDDMAWSKSNLAGPDVTYVHRSAPVDLAVMSRCSHVIMSTGTFGWWGGWLAGGKVVYFRNFPRSGSAISNEYRAQDFFPPEWLPLDE